MSKKLTVKEAIEQGYFYFGQDKERFQHLHSIEFISDADFENGPVMLAEKDSYYTPAISSEEIAETLADIVYSQCGDMTGDDTDDVFDIVKNLDFTDAAERINNALVKKKYYKLTNIELIPNPTTNDTQRIKDAAVKYTRDEGYQKAYIAGATAVNDKSQGLVDALEWIKTYGPVNDLTVKFIDNAIAKWKGEGEQAEICEICKEKPVGKDITVCNDCYYSFDGDRRGFWKNDEYQ